VDRGSTPVGLRPAPRSASSPQTHRYPRAHETAEPGRQDASGRQPSVRPIDARIGAAPWCVRWRARQAHESEELNRATT